MMTSAAPPCVEAIRSDARTLPWLRLYHVSLDVETPLNLKMYQNSEMCLLVAPAVANSNETKYSSLPF